MNFVICVVISVSHLTSVALKPLKLLNRSIVEFTNVLSLIFFENEITDSTPGSTLVVSISSVSGSSENGTE